MLAVAIDNKEYDVISGWQEMKLSKAVELYAVISKIPLQLKLLYSLSFQKDSKEQIEQLFKEFTGDELVKTFPDFYRKVVVCLSNIPEDISLQINHGYITAFYKEHCESFVIALLHLPIDFQPKPIESFEFEGVTYHLPESKQILGEPRLMANITALELVESIDLETFAVDLEGGKYERFANIIAILCRTKDKEGKIVPYNEEESLKIAEKFMGLPMDVVWEVFFCVSELCLLSEQRTALSLLRTMLKRQRRELEADSVASGGMPISS